MSIFDYAAISFPRHQLEAQYRHGGVDLPDEAAAWRELTAFAGEILEEVEGPGQEWSIEVTVSERRLLYRIDLASRKLG